MLTCTLILSSLYHTVAGVDFTRVVGEQLAFVPGQNRACHDIQITEDDICEPAPHEDFFSRLTYVSGRMPIIIDPPRTHALIDDTNEPECRKYRKYMDDNLRNAQYILNLWHFLCGGYLILILLLIKN